MRSPTRHPRWRAAAPMLQRRFWYGRGDRGAMSVREVRPRTPSNYQFKEIRTQKLYEMASCYTVVDSTQCRHCFIRGSTGDATRLDDASDNGDDGWVPALHQHRSPLIIQRNKKLYEKQRRNREDFTKRAARRKRRPNSCGTRSPARHPRLTAKTAVSIPALIFHAL